jgi:GntR family transcriptional regulator of vanillate catabolism
MERIGAGLFNGTFNIYDRGTSSTNPEGPVRLKRSVAKTNASLSSRRIPEGAKSKTSSQTARATLTLREMLVQGALRPGDRIKEVPLAAQLGISRIPLHLALERLMHEGFLEAGSKRGFIVQRFSTRDIWDSIELRGLLEGAAARMAAERQGDRGELTVLEETSREMADLARGSILTVKSFARYIELNATFHSELVTLSDSRMLRRAIERVCSLPFASPSAFLNRQHVSPHLQYLFQIAADQHLGIVDAIRNGEGMRAETLTREHARVARRNLDDAIAATAARNDGKSVKVHTVTQKPLAERPGKKERRIVASTRRAPAGNGAPLVDGGRVRTSGYRDDGGAGRSKG